MPKEDFEYASKIGKGSFSVVEKVKRVTDGKYYAMKKVTTIIRCSLRPCPTKKRNTRSMKYACWLPLSTQTSSHTTKHSSIPTFCA